MAESNGRLTLAGLAQILRDHMDGTAARFAEVANQFAEVRVQLAEVRGQISDLRGEIAGVGALFRELAQIVLRQVDQLDEHRREIRQIYSRMEQHDIRMEAMSRDIRRILDAMERRGGDGGSRDQQSA